MDTSLLSNIQKLFSERIDVFSPVEFNKVQATQWPCLPWALGRGQLQQPHIRSQEAPGTQSPSLFLGNVSRSKCSPSAPHTTASSLSALPWVCSKPASRGVTLVCLFGLCSYALHSRGSSLGIAVPHVPPHPARAQEPGALPPT